MATGFMWRNCSAALLCLLAAAPAVALEVRLVGTFGDKAAILMIDGAGPRTVRIGRAVAGVTVVSVERDSAVIEVAGARRTLARGQHYSTGAGDARQSVTLAADTRGHFITDGAINDKPVRFVIDTGATMVALPAADALRLGLDYRKGEVGLTKTAAGVVPVYRVRFERVRLGGIEIAGVDGVVIEQGLDIALLGMSFLSRVEMKNEGQLMTLTRRY